MAAAAREAAAAELAVMAAQRARIESMIDNGNLRNLTEAESAKIAQRMADLDRRRIQTETALDFAMGKRKETVRAVVRAAEAEAKAQKGSNEEIEIAITGLGDLGSAAGAAAGDVIGLSDALGDDGLTSTVGTLSDAWGDFVASGFEDFTGFADSVKGTFKRLLSDMISMASRNRIMIMLGMGGSVGGTAASASQSGIGNSLLGGLGSSIGGIVGGLSSGVDLGVSTLLQSGISGYGAMLGAQGAAAMTGSLTAIAGMAGALLPVIAIVALLAKGLSRKYAGTAIRGNLGSDGFEGTQFDFHKGGWLRSNRAYYSDVTPEIQAMLDGAMGAITDNLRGMSAALGISSDAINDFTADQFTLWINGKSAEEITHALNAELTATAEEMAALILTTDEYSMVGETSLSSLTRLSTGLLTANDAMDLLGHAAFLVSLRSADAASNLVEAFGGVEAMTGVVNTYWAAFYSDAERTETTVRRLGMTFADLGMMMPESRAQFRAVVEGIDLTTESGRQMYAQMISLSGAMDQVLPQVAVFTASMSGLLDQIGGEIGIQIEAARSLSSDSRQAASLWYRTATTLRSFLSDLLNTDLTAASRGQVGAVNRNRFNTAFDMARGGDVDAARDISGLAKAYLSSAQAGASSSLEYRRISAQVQGQIRSLAGIAELEGSQDELLASLYERQIGVLTNLGNFLQLEGLTGAQIEGLDQSIQDMAADWDGTVGVFETSLGALEAAIVNAEAFNFDDGLRFTIDSSLNNIFGGVASSSDTLADNIIGLGGFINVLDGSVDGLSGSMDALGGLLSQLRAAVEAETGECLRAQDLIALQGQGSAAAAVVAQHQQRNRDTLSTFNDLRQQFRVSLVGGNETVGISAAGFLQSSFDFYGGTTANLIAFVNALETQFGTRSYGGTINAGNAGLSDERDAVTGLRRQIEALGMIPAFARGGTHRGGPAYIGENDLELVSPSRIYSPAETKAMLDNRVLVKEIVALRHEVSGMRDEVAAANRVKINKLKSISDLEDKADLFGPAPARATA